MSKLKESLIKLVHNYLSLLKRRNKKFFVFGAWFGQKFADNPKYLYLYCLKSGLNACWITKNASVYEELSGKGMPVEMAYSEKGIRVCRNAGYIFYCTSLSDVNENYVGGASLINLWHGIPLKKIMYDDKINVIHNTLKAKIEPWLYKLPYKKNYVVSTSDLFSKIYQRAFKISSSHVLQWGQPRNDCFFDNTLKKKKYSNVDYEKMVAYMPTHRNEGKTPLCLENVFDLEKLNNYCKKNKILFVVKKHFYHKHENEQLELFSNIVDLTQEDCDPQEMMYSADIMITDYSSCYIDFMLLNRPIIFYAFDYDHYLVNDREMYFNYEDVIPGKKIDNFQDLITALDDVQTSCSDWRIRHEKIKNIFYSKDNQYIVSKKIMDHLTRGKI